MKVTFFHTLYKKEVSWICDNITFTENEIKFVSGGKKYSVELEYVRKIEM